MLGNVHHQIVPREELPLPHRFWYVLPDLSYGIQYAVAAFQLGPEHLMTRKLPQVSSSRAWRELTSIHYTTF